ncbi:MAG: pyridoxamine 5'-phosphate oxidase family protein [Bacteroidota bacterium]
MSSIFAKTDSLADFHQKCWDQLLRASVDKKHPMREITMATLKLDGSVDQRMVVLRLAERSSLSINTYTDLRAQKVAQIKVHPQLHYLAWHPKQRLQLRLKCEAQLHSNDEISRSAWQKLSYFARTLYSAHASPGQIVPNLASANAPYQHPEGIDSNLWYKNFVLIKAKILEMEALALGRERQLRARFTYEAGQVQANWLIP